MSMWQKMRKVFIYLSAIWGLSFLYGCISTGIYNKIGENGEAVIPEKYNVILILLDSVRADHLSCYGYHRKTSSAIDQLAKEGILFRQAISQATWSLPAQCSIFTAKYVPAHGVDDIHKKLSNSELTLAEILKIYGYKTAAFTGGFWVGSIFNLGQGFDVYDDKLTFGKLRDTVPLAISWLEKNKGNRFFLLLQGFDGHSPFNLPKSYEEMYTNPNYNGIFKTLTIDHRIGDRLFGYTFFLDYDYKKKVKITDRDIDYIIARYDASITYGDGYIGQFLKKIKEFGLEDNTIVILTSYHGTPLFEHGIILRRKHGSCAEGVIHIPLIIRHPGLNKMNREIDNMVQQIDFMPTILDFLGIPINHQAQGSSLIPLIEGKAGSGFNKYVYSTGHNEMVIKTKTWKLIDVCPQTGREALELYNLQKDPAEQNNLIRKEQKVAKILKRKLDEWLERLKVNSEKLNLIPEYEIDKIKEEMKKAGYWFLDAPIGKAVMGRQVSEEVKVDIDNQ